MRALTVTGYGVRKRVLGAVTMVQPTVQDWQEGLAKPGPAGGCEATPVRTYPPQVAWDISGTMNAALTFGTAYTPSQPDLYTPPETLSIGKAAPGLPVSIAD